MTSRSTQISPALPGPVMINSAEVRELKRMLDGALSEGTVDQLGFGILFDSIAESLFPWCSTLTTRIKYLLWSPAILQQAVHIRTRRIIGETPRDLLTTPQLKQLEELHRSPDLGAMITRMESALAIALYYKYRDNRAGQGIFGSRNLGYKLKTGIQSTQKLISGRGLLSTSARYPNAIYWNSLSEMGLYAEGIDSKKKAIQLLVQGKSPWASDWEQQIELIRQTEISRIWDRLGSYDKHPEEICRGQWIRHFNGFELDADSRLFLMDKLINCTPFWKPVLQRKWPYDLTNEAKTYEIFEQAIENEDAKKRCQAAALAIKVCTPLREIYQHLTTGKIEIQCKAYEWPMMKHHLDQLKKLLLEIDPAAHARNESLFIFLDNVFAVQLEKHPVGLSKPLKASITLIIHHENRVLKARRKFHRRLLIYREIPRKDGYRSREAMSKSRGQGMQDAEVSEITFRLGSAINFFNDLRAEVS